MRVLLLTSKRMCIAVFTCLIEIEELMLSVKFD